MRLSDEDGEAFGFLHDRHVAAILETPSPRELKTQDTSDLSQRFVGSRRRGC